MALNKTSSSSQVTIHLKISSAWHLQLRHNLRQSETFWMTRSRIRSPHLTRISLKIYCLQEILRFKINAALSRLWKPDRRRASKWTMWRTKTWLSKSVTTLYSIIATSLGLIDLRILQVPTICDSRSQPLMGSTCKAVTTVHL